MRNLITKPIYDAMLEMKKSGISSSEIARAFGMHRTAVIYNLSGQRKNPPGNDSVKTMEILANAMERCVAERKRAEEIMAKAIGNHTLNNTLFLKP